MQAVQYDAFGVMPLLVEVSAPECADDGVLIRVRASGVCRSDWHAWQGHDPVTLPRIPGHEFAGVIVEVGANVALHHVGDRVTVPFVVGCGVCEWCVAGEAPVCPDQRQPGFTLPGSFAELVAIPAADTNVVLLPDSLHFVAAASLGCRFATAFRAVTVHGRVGASEWVVVHGCGGVGLSAVMIAASLGARVIAVDSSQHALERAVQFGAIATVTAGDGVLERIRSLTGSGAHVSIDAVGSATTAAVSVRSLRRRGRHVQVGLLFGADASTPLPMDEVIAKELEIYGSHGMAARHYPAMLELVASGRVRPDLLVGTVISLADAPAALAAMSEPSSAAGMTVIELSANVRAIQR